MGTPGSDSLFDRAHAHGVDPNRPTSLSKDRLHTGVSGATTLSEIKSTKSDASQRAAAQVTGSPFIQRSHSSAVTDSIASLNFRARLDPFRGAMVFASRLLYRFSVPSTSRSTA